MLIIKYTQYKYNQNIGELATAALIAGGANLLGAGASSISSNLNTHAAYSRQKRLMMLEHQYNIEDWQRQNAYNHPAAQMQRLREGGLNPALTIGGVNPQATGGDMAATDVPGEPTTPMQSSQILSDNIGKIGNDISNAILQSTQAAKNQQDTIKAAEETQGIHIDNQTRAELNKQTIENIKAGIRLTGEKMRTEDTLQRMNEEEILNKQEQRKQIIQETILKQVQTEEGRERIRQIQNQIRNDNARLTLEQRQVACQEMIAKATSDNLTAAAAYSRQLAKEKGLQNFVSEWAHSMGYDTAKYHIDLDKMTREVDNLIQQGDKMGWESKKIEREIFNMNLTDAEKELYKDWYGTILMIADHIGTEFANESLEAQYGIEVNAPTLGEGISNRLNKNKPK